MVQVVTGRELAGLEGLLARYNIKVKLFADDVKLYVKVINAVDVTVLHEALACPGYMG